MTEIVHKKRGIPSPNAEVDILGRAQLARSRLNLPEDAQWLASRFVDGNVAKLCVMEDRRIEVRHKQKEASRKRRGNSKPRPG